MAGSGGPYTRPWTLDNSQLTNSDEFARCVENLVAPPHGSVGAHLSARSHEDEQKSWRPTLELITDRGWPWAFTSYNQVRV